MWAIEGCNGIGKHIANRLVHDGETARRATEAVRAGALRATGNGRKTDPVDAHSEDMSTTAEPLKYRQSA